jgi:hypothetical protein
MAAIPVNLEQMDLMNFSYNELGFEYRCTREFKFDAYFIERDQGQLQDQPITLDAQDLLNQLRHKEMRVSTTTPPAMYEFYDKCRKHFFQEFTSLLTGLISNLEATRKLRDHNSQEHLLDFFNIKLDGQINFGKNQIFINCAARCNDTIQAKLRTCGKEIQMLVEAARKEVTAEACTKLQACSEDFTTFGEQEWMRLCKETSRHNILDQHFVIKYADSEQEDSSDEDQMFVDNKSTICTPSSWLYEMAINDSKMDLDKEIRHRRKQKTDATAKMARLRAAQANVSIQADSVRPQETLADRFSQIDERLDSIDERVQNNAPSTAHDSPVAKDIDQALLQRIQQLEQTVESLRTVSNPRELSKNEKAAGCRDQPADTFLRTKRIRDGDTNSDIATEAPAPSQLNTRRIHTIPQKHGGMNANAQLHHRMKTNPQGRGGANANQQQHREIMTSKPQHQGGMKVKPQFHRETNTNPHHGVSDRRPLHQGVYKSSVTFTRDTTQEPDDEQPMQEGRYRKFHRIQSQAAFHTQRKPSRGRGRGRGREF